MKVSFPISVPNHFLNSEKAEWQEHSVVQAPIPHQDTPDTPLTQLQCAAMIVEKRRKGQAVLLSHLTEHNRTTTST